VTANTLPPIRAILTLDARDSAESTSRGGDEGGRFPEVRRAGWRPVLQLVGCAASCSRSQAIVFFTPCS